MEIFDAFDEHGNVLDFDLVRGEFIPLGVYHKIVQIYTLDENNRILITKRHPLKHFGYYWEITAGSVIKGENELEAAVRELYEETGISVEPNQLQLVQRYLGQNSIWFTYIHKVNMQTQTIRLAENETIDYRFISYDEFNHMIQTKQFPRPSLEYYKIYNEQFLKCFNQFLSK
jgi:8-oxo-dGTP pyrophosphatase MutT (NUDIX family)